MYVCFHCFCRLYITNIFCTYTMVTAAPKPVTSTNYMNV